MKKIFLLFLLIFILIFIISEILFIKDDNKIINSYEKISFYKKDNLNRYISYKKKNPDLTSLEIVTQVNLNLDKEDYTYTKETTYLNTPIILINKHIYLPSNYIPDNLVKINNKYTDSDKFLIEEANNSLEKMLDDASKNNLTIRIISAYRSYTYQKTLYNNYVAKDGIKLADTYSARPGFSEHQTGLVIDVDNRILNYEQFENTDEYKWMIDNSYKYGFILRYPKGKETITTYSYEAWHYRYVGKEIATYLYKNNMTFDEYYIRFIEK